MKENVFFSDLSRLKKIKEKFRKDGVEKLHVLSDFDRTLTQVFSNGQKTPSVISVLRSNSKYLGQDYAKKAQLLFEKYHPIEIDSEIKFQKKEILMREWWIKHYKLLIDKKLNKKHLEEIVEDGKIDFRKESLPFFDFLNQYKIPLIIMSANGLGGEIISMMLEKKDKLYPNIYVVSNHLRWDKKGNLIGFKEPIVHCLNKKGILLEKLSFYKKVKDRKNVLLMGDNPEDKEMVAGFNYENLIKIGFLNEKIEELLSYYKKDYDVLILKDSSMDFVNNFLFSLVEN